MGGETLVTVALLTYNQERFVKEAVESILQQDYRPLQVVISDDCSNDSTYPLLEKVVQRYMGPHEIQLNRNEENLGIGRHVNKIMSLAEGELIAAAAGDDVSFPNRITKTVRHWERTGKKQLSICSNVVLIDTDSQDVGTYPPVRKLSSLAETLHTGDPWIYGSSHAWHRSLFDVFGPLSDEVIAEDRAIGFRSLLLGQEIGSIDEPLVKYRVHTSSVTNDSTPMTRLWQKICTMKSYLYDLDRINDLSGIEKQQELKTFRIQLQKTYDNFCFNYEMNHASLINRIGMVLFEKNVMPLPHRIRLFCKSMSRRNTKIGW